MLAQQKKIKAIQYGLGAMGSGMARIMLEKENIEVVGAISDLERDKGKDLGEVIGLDRKVGIIVENDAEKVLKAVSADVVLIATCSFMSDIVEQALPALSVGKNVITIAEEASFPTKKNKEFFDQLDKIAKKNNVTILGTGINPGFMLDYLPISITTLMIKVNEVKIQRVVNYAKYGKSVWEHIGVGESIETFNAGCQSGELVLHVGLEQTTLMTAEALRLEVDEYTETKEGIISKSVRKTEFGEIKPGEVCGFKQQGILWKNKKALITHEIIGLINPDKTEDEVETGTHIWLVGDPGVYVFVGGEIADEGGKGTYAHAVNSIPEVINAKPGFITVLDLPPSPCRS